MKRILFVDDESNILDGIRRSLHADRDRWDMQFVVGGEAALQACEASSFDVVITDMRMPGMDGATLLGHIRDRYPNTARIILSGFTDAVLATRAVPVAHRFLAKPCNAADLHSAIDRVCAMQDLLSSPELRKIVGAVGELPSLSTTYTDLTHALKDPKTSIPQVAEIIERDIAMSAKVLQLANSAFFGLARKVNSLSNAVSCLGMETIKNLALTSEVFRVFVPDARVPRSFCDSIQHHAIRTAAIANLLPVEQGSRDITAVAALLHDIGSLFLASAMPKEFCAALASASERGCKHFEAEEELLGISHAEIGAYLLGLWGIPGLAVEAIAHHHHPTRVQHTAFDCTIAVYVADFLANELEDHPQGTTGIEIAESDRICLDELGVLAKIPEFRELAQRCRS
jgi:HD-like signal output (HDOD) protein/ActR/RegA family two-component response regulator